MVIVLQKIDILVRINPNAIKCLIDFYFAACFMFLLENNNRS